VGEIPTRCPRLGPSPLLLEARPRALSFVLFSRAPCRCQAAGLMRYVNPMRAQSRKVFVRPRLRLPVRSARLSRSGWQPHVAVETRTAILAVLGCRAHGALQLVVEDFLFLLNSCVAYLDYGGALFIQFSRPLSARWWHVANFPSLSARACPRVL